MDIEWDQLDQLFSTSLASERPTEKQTTIGLLMFASWLLFLLGWLNNICSFATFHRSKCRRVGIGYYLLCMSVVNQINLSLLALRLTHMVLNAQSYSDPLFILIGCKMLNYLLVTSSRIPYWLVALIAIERAYVAIVVNGQWLNKPSVTKGLIVLMLTGILSSTSYELYFIQSYVDLSTNKGAICILQFHHIWTQIHRTVMIVHTLVPFLINLCCTATIICAVTKKKMNLNVPGARKFRRDISRSFIVLFFKDAHPKNVNELPTTEGKNRMVSAHIRHS
jgi:hypothetical protein